MKKGKTCYSSSCLSTYHFIICNITCDYKYTFIILEDSLRTFALLQLQMLSNLRTDTLVNREEKMAHATLYEITFTPSDHVHMTYKTNQ